MGKRGGKKKANNGKSIASSSSLSIKEQASGKKQSHNAKSILKLNHFQNLAQWASSSLPIECNNEPSMGCLGAFFGRRFAEFGESLGISPGPSLFSCQRCETILQPGINCTIRIEKNRAKTRRRSKTTTATQNNVVYTCHFCSHRNLKRGTSKGYMRELAPPKPSFSKLKSAKSAKSVSQTCVAEKSNFSDVETARTADSTNSASQTCTVEKSNPSDVNRTAEVPSPAVSNTSNSLSVTPSSSLANSGAKLLDSKKRKRKKPEPKKSADEKLVNSAPADKEKTSGASQKRKKSWTTLKEIAESEQHERNQRFTKFSIPFIL